MNWSEVLGSESGTTDVNTVFQSFYDRITEIINKYAPIRKLSREEIKSLSKPWVRTSFISDLLRRGIHIFSLIKERSRYVVCQNLISFAT